MIGKTISHYKILEKLGSGGMGIVYKAEDTRLDRHVALKFLPQHLSQAEEEKERFIHEAKAASALDHPNICNIYEIDETEDGQMFIAMACYDGESLKDRIDRGPLPIDAIIDIATQIAQGLAKAHSKDIVHRDIKPANVMLTKDGQVKIVDFGLAKLAGRTMLTKAGTTLGTIAYMSPEQTQGTEIGYRTDIWALGVVLYEMLSGEHPFKGDYEQAMMYSIMNEDPEPVSTLRRDVPEALAQIIHHALEKEPKARYASCADMLTDLRSLRDGEPSQATVSLRGLLRKPRFAIPAILVLAALCFFAVRFYNASAKIQWARNTALPEIDKLLEKQKFGEAFSLARQAERYIPEDPLLRKMLQSCSLPVWIKTTPSGAEVYCRNYLSVDADWEYLGRTPLDSIHAPTGYLQWKIIKEGFEPIEWAFATWFAHNVDIRLHPRGAGPANMVHVPGGTYRLWSADPVELQEYWIDKYEVTNQDYKAFVDAGGYQKQAYWKHPFVMQDRTLSWEEAMALFRDKTGQPGPSTWKLGSFPEGRADYPVGGISWYEAAVYAEFAGKSLPTIYHWYKAAYGRSPVYSDAVVLSNFKGEGPARVGQFQGLGGVGTYDMAGNVQEWCWTQARKNRRYILGGAWNDPEYMFGGSKIQMPFDRSETNGFRCVKHTADLAQTVTDAIEPVSFSRDFTREKPVEDEIFQIYKSYFLYDSTDLNAVVESVDEGMAHWRKETVTFDAAYGNERVIAHLFLPKNAVAPYQTVIYFPGSQAFHLRSSENLAEMAVIDFIPRTGRTLVYPVYKNTYERRLSTPLSGARAFRGLMIQQVKDFGRTIDYLQTREDIDTNRLAYMGLSSGARRGPVFTAVDQRLKASVLIWGGFTSSKPPDEIAPINFAPRARIPVLMINGRYDFIFPLETSQRPLFRLLGAPEKDKRHVIIAGGHVTPMNDVIKETLKWLDRYLGPVQRQVQGSEE